MELMSDPLLNSIHLLSPWHQESQLHTIYEKRLSLFSY